MFTRVAFFEGEIRSGQEADFERLLNESMQPVAVGDRNARFRCFRQAPADVPRFTEKADRAGTDQ